MGVFLVLDGFGDVLDIDLKSETRLAAGA